MKNSLIDTGEMVEFIGKPFFFYSGEKNYVFFFLIPTSLERKFRLFVKYERECQIILQTFWKILHFPLR